jgi:hypothetical protein
VKIKSFGGRFAYDEISLLNLEGVGGDLESCLVHPLL